ncbi:MAG: hypothetical protein Q7J47_03400 [Azoarcus sp.]|nr:hypothetical protein [Azoarcus sp.]
MQTYARRLPGRPGALTVRQLLDDGQVAITFEPRGGTVRALDSVPDTDDHPPYIAVGEITPLSDDIVKIHAFAGQLHRRHMRLIVRLLLEQGFRVAYVDRAAGHALPMAERIETGDWVGWWRLDLVRVRLGSHSART